MHYVRGHWRRGGEYVRSHYRRDPTGRPPRAVRTLVVVLLIVLAVAVAVVLL